MAPGRNGWRVTSALEDAKERQFEGMLTPLAPAYLTRTRRRRLARARALKWALVAVAVALAVLTFMEAWYGGL